MKGLVITTVVLAIAMYAFTHVSIDAMAIIAHAVNLLATK